MLWSVSERNEQVIRKPNLVCRVLLHKTSQKCQLLQPISRLLVRLRSSIRRVAALLLELDLLLQKGLRPLLGGAVLEEQRAHKITAATLKQLPMHHQLIRRGRAPLLNLQINRNLTRRVASQQIGNHNQKRAVLCWMPPWQRQRLPHLPPRLRLQPRLLLTCQLQPPPLPPA